MKTFTCSNHSQVPSARQFFATAKVLIVLLACVFSSTAFSAEESGLSDKAKAAAQGATTAVKEAGRSVAADVEQLWQRIDAARLKNRTRDEIVAWIIMGVLVGALAGMMTTLKPTGLGKLGRLLLGLVGAALGGILVRVTRLDFGWGPVLIRYEELFFSFIGAIALIILARLIRSRSSKKANS
jgi:uncharacterized membrane protein YeaQ/YmgE (transglycosylase-associated protein family)